MLFILLLFCADITDLGVMTPHRLIALTPCTNRADFLMFHIELQALNWPSNSVSFQTTNRVLPMEAFLAMPPGPVLMGVRSICADNEESPLSVFKLDIRRDPPHAPVAKVVVKSERPVSRQSLSNVFRLHRENIPPPTPGQTNQSAFPGPLPNGHSKTYSDGIIEMQKLIAEHSGKRRNQ